jgi:peptidyl-prolyl cis-trans isomerase SurA
MKKFLLFLSLGLFFQFATAQVLDRIVAIIGEEVILQSDIENQYNYLIIQGEKDDGTLRCQVMESLIVSKLLLNKAEQDSIVVSEAEVANEIDRRLEYILAQMDGNVREFERIYGKSVAQFREDIAPEIEDELLVNRQRSTLLQEAEITPREVKVFYEGLNVDSIGLLPAEVELNHIVVVPPPSDESIEKVKADLLEYKRMVTDEGADFGDLAARYSDEPGAFRSRGYLGEFSRGVMVPEFEAMVFQMRPGEISDPFRTEYGYHIVYLQERRGQVVQASHILKRLSPSANGDSIAIDSLNRILDLINTDSLTFEQAAIRYSSDRITKHCGGCLTNPQTQELRIPMDLLDADMFFKVDEMEAGEISDPMEMTMADNSKAFHVLYLKNKVPPHKPNLKDDYQKIRDTALRSKQMENFDKWLESAKKNIYIDIKPTECINALQNWVE